MLAQMLVERGPPGDERETHAIVDHGEPARGKRDALAVDAGYGIALLGRVARQSGAGHDAFRRPGELTFAQGVEQVAGDDDSAALPPCQSFALKKRGALGQCALDLGSEPAAGMGCLGRQQLPVEPGCTVGADLPFERQV